NMDSGAYRDDWRRYEDWKENIKANKKVKQKKREVHIKFHAQLDNDLIDQHGNRSYSGSESERNSEYDVLNLPQEKKQASYPRIRKRTNEHLNDNDVQSVFINTKGFPALKEYCEILRQLMNNHLEEDSQLGRHLFQLLAWSVVDNTQHQKMWDAIPILNRILKEGKIETVQSNFISIVQRWLGSEPAYFAIDALTALSALTSLLLFVPSPVRPGAHPSENHLKSQLWTKILSDAFTLNTDSFNPIWELHHQVSASSGRGSARSDFACIITSPITKEQYPFFILEFEVDGIQIHKDFAVVVSEAVHALNRIISARVILESEISLAQMHVALVNNAHIRFGLLRPFYHQERNEIIYIYDQNVRCFDLQSGCTANDIENMFNLIVYLRQV
ncbi:2736_t:CDS:2, partial [Racocetra persica]